jgi:glutamate-1-semialdehyde 2,1-aminomutase
MTADRQRYAAFFQAMLERGVYFPPAQFEAFFTSRAHGDEEINRTIEIAGDALRSLAQ